MHEIGKEFGFDYGHRVHVQKLNTEYSLDDACVCRHLHGHRGKVIVFLESDFLNNESMVTDFKHLNWFKKFLDDVLDHKFIIDKNDPLYRKIIGDATPLLNKEMESMSYQIIDLQSDVWSDMDPDTPMYEYYEGFVIVDFVPTSENLSKWLFQIVKKKMAGIGVKCSRIQFFETPKSQANYHE